MKAKKFSVVVHALMFSAMPLILAADDAKQSGGLKGIADTIAENMKALAGLVGQVAFLAGMLFFVSAIFKFKQHKDNPTQVPVGTPLSMLAISAALMFMGNFIQPLGQTLFGDETKAESAGKGATGLTAGFGSDS